ncbi:hypothetical protein NQ166_09495 [Microbacterium sp. zg.Y1090]|uniref:rolling circle replication-associated protein n=1 Tax=Microbacterium wangruii TaxID=3049073 RepID=UPI00214D498B|nr:hypothetical protein [Microbacterium sp. zg.Y1090]MCR2819059.1 hypothetical protein [Microbacterium sp. zg.Y1090]
MSSQSLSSLVPLARPDAGWSFTLVPAAGEGGGSFRTSLRRKPDYVARGQAADPARAAAEAARRARTRLRRYCAGNGLNRLGTLTYRGEGNHDPVLVRQHLGVFFRDLRARTGGAAFPYAWVPEWHKTAHGLHAHFAVGKYIKKSTIAAAWPHGFVGIKQLGNLPVGSTVLSEARVAGGYLAKYVAKSFSDPVARDLGAHRYDVAEGFQPDRLRFSGRSREEVLARASEHLAASPAVVWDSAEAEDWQGPPTLWAQWGR